MSERGKQRSNLPRRCRDLGIDSLAVRRLVSKSNAQAAGIAADFLQERPLRWWRDIGARRLGAVDRVQHCRAIAHADADDMAAGEATPAFAAVRPERSAGA